MDLAECYERDRRRQPLPYSPALPINRANMATTRHHRDRAPGSLIGERTPLLPPPGGWPEDANSNGLREYMRATALANARRPSNSRFLPKYPVRMIARAIPIPVWGITFLAILINMIVWAVVGAIVYFHPKLYPSIALSWILGLCHALDAPTVAVINLVTRRLIANGQRPCTIGFWFSLGYSTIVIITCILVAATGGALVKSFGNISQIGTVIGTSISTMYLAALCGTNIWVLYQVCYKLKAEVEGRVRRPPFDICIPRDIVEATGDGAILEELVDEEAYPTVFEDEENEPAAQLRIASQRLNYFERLDKRWKLKERFLKISGKLYKMIDRPWKMFPTGMLFGLRFRASAKIALLGLTSIQVAQVNIWLILIYPALFTVGMCLVDSVDSAVFMTLYTSRAFERSVTSILNYSIVMTAVTIFASTFVCAFECLALARTISKPQPGNAFWDGVTAIEDNFAILGGGICALIILMGVMTIFFYRSWGVYQTNKARLHARWADWTSRRQFPVNPPPGTNQNPPLSVNPPSPPPSPLPTLPEYLPLPDAEPANDQTHWMLKPLKFRLTMWRHRYQRSRIPPSPLDAASNEELYNRSNTQRMNNLTAEDFVEDERQKAWAKYKGWRIIKEYERRSREYDEYRLAHNIN
ncbi:hypothetical protein PspLS_09612 [Pyricularia sp. CBS 133598]|nr:hypothetical protein PspLS_09612 [Pyricularia sp. CBS 133598]